MKNPISPFILSIRSSLVVIVVVASICLVIGFQISEAQTDIPAANPPDAFHESEQLARSEHVNSETRRDDAETLNEDIPPVLPDKNSTTSISGRLSTTEGLGILHGQMNLLEEGGTSRIAVSDSFGYFRFTEIPTGQKVTIKSAEGSRYICAPITLQLTGISNSNFTCTQSVNAKAAKAPPPSPPTCVDVEITDRSRPPLDSDQQALLPIAGHPGCRNSGSH